LMLLANSLSKGRCVNAFPFLTLALALDRFTVAETHQSRRSIHIEVAANGSLGSIMAATNSSASEATTWDMLLTSSQRSRKVRGGNYVQLATVGSGGMPACRTVVFRGLVDIDDGAAAIKMITDARSQKVEHVTAVNPAAEMVWWFSQTSEQYRIAGEIFFVGNSGVMPMAKTAKARSFVFSAKDQERLKWERKQQWGNLRDKGKEQFFWSNPGIAYSGQPIVPEGGRGTDGKVMPPPDEFLLMLLVPHTIKYLRLGDNYAQQSIWSKSKGWVDQRVNP